MRTDPSRSRSLLVVGSIAFDTIRTPRARAPRVLGGSAVYFSAAARFFCPVKIVGVIGEDFPVSTLEKLRRIGIDTTGVLTQKGKTFRWKGYYKADMNRAFTQKTELNVFASFRPLLSAPDRTVPHLFLANIDPALQLNVLNQMRRPKWAACDTMNFWIRNARENLMRVLARVDICLVNDAEIRELSGHMNLLKAARWALRRGPSLVLVKKGEHGTLCVWRGQTLLYPAYLLEDVADPTGAGDSFAGGFLGYLTRFKKAGVHEIRHAIAYAAVVASFNVERFGPERLIALTKKEIDTRYARYKRMISID